MICACRSASTRTMVESITEGLVSDPAMLEGAIYASPAHINALSDLVDDLYDMAQLDTNGIRLERSAPPTSATCST